MRIHIDLPPDMLLELDDLLERKGYVSRSEFVRAALRAYMAQRQAEA